MVRPLAALVAAMLLAGCGSNAKGDEAPTVPTIVGTLTYRLSGGAAHELAHPVHGECVTFDGPATSIDNTTDATAHLRDGCDGAEGDVIIPNTTWEQGSGPPARAVVMLRH